MTMNLRVAYQYLRRKAEVGNIFIEEEKHLTEDILSEISSSFKKLSLLQNKISRHKELDHENEAIRKALVRLDQAHKLVRTAVGVLAKNRAVPETSKGHADLFDWENQYLDLMPEMHHKF